MVHRLVDGPLRKQALVDLTVIAIPGYFGSIGAEYLWLKNHRDERGPTPADYEWRDTLVSLGMGQLSLFAPMVVKKILDPVKPGTGRYAKALVGVAAGAAVAVSIADLLAQRADGRLPEAGVVPDSARSGVEDARLAAVDEPVAPAPAAGRNRSGRRRARKILDAVRTSAGAGAVVATGVAVAAAWSQRTAGSKLYEKKLLGDRGTGALAVLGATLGWDAIYYWNHRLAHESRYLWAMHVVHHSSEHYNLATALRQPVADALVVSIPYGALSLLGYRPEVIETARGINLIYQFWIHTEVVPKLPRFDKYFNSPSLHRVHHGSNQKYLDRNHGSILIIWDRIFGTYQPEEERVVYGLTRNIKTFNPLRVASHEWRDLLRDSAGSTNWADRLGFVLRGPGWAYRRREELATDALVSEARAPSAPAAAVA
jgi:sterol desaturase/sphingolipid hydroxylase (fatty acid hydroxylase superfamily)